MSFINSFLEQPVRTYKKRKTRSDKKVCTHVWLSDDEYKKIFLAAKKKRKTMTQFCSDIVIRELESTKLFSMIKHEVQFKQTNVKLSQDMHERVVDLAAEWGCIPVRHAVHRILISSLRSEGVL
ncbi:hypothetical protein [Priestia aryabhattai]|uniref:hypothetical protein n=1 Tax=Priestia aryabhattai TaxID=412384 RepID=UPI002E24F2E1|nr:hypothetical protein [Priestia aryabhattai]